MVDYGRWDEMSRSIEAQEQAELEQEREERRLRYELKRREEAIKYKEKYGVDPPKSSCCGFASNPEQLLKESKQKHTHKDNCCSSPSSETLLSEKNLKKMRAAHATREDGNRLFREGDFETALAVYDRGVLIINGMYGLDDEQYEEMNQLEAVLNLNMAAVYLKTNKFAQVISQCRMVLNLDDKNVKAYYRLAQAYDHLGETEKALDSLETAVKISPNDVAICRFLKEIHGKIQEQNRKHQLEQKRMAEAMANRSRSIPQ